ncbi:MAG: hypothetical protein WA642_12280 [Steroidobacteraceae bacterium]
MSRITVDNLAAAIRKVRGMSVKEKEALADEIYLHQPHLLASCLVQSRLGVEPAAVEFLLNILFVCYQSMKESGLHWSVITEDEQERQIQRWIGAVQFSEHAARSVADGAGEQYVTQHPEQPLLAFVMDETNRRLRAISERNAEAESDKFVMMTSMNLVNCIAGVHVSSAVHG